MFTGLIGDIGHILKTEDGTNLRRFRIGTTYAPEYIPIGASIACSGACMTVIDKGTSDNTSWFDVDAAFETLEKTTVSAWKTGDRINLERSLKLGDELGGHMVTGHVDGLADLFQIDELQAEGDWGATKRFHIRVPSQLAKFIAAKGSVALDGTSLTVNSMNRNVLSVLLIPHTLVVTNWGDRKVGDHLNVEVDLMARYAVRLAEAREEGY